MNCIMKLAHNLLQYFCYENPTNQAKLYELYFNDYQQLSEVRMWVNCIYFLLIFHRNKKSKHAVIYFSTMFTYVKQ